MLDEVIISKMQNIKLPKVSGIYGIRNLVNGKIYVGSSKNIQKRIVGHKTLLNKNKHKNTYLQNSWNKYGYSNFLFYTIEFCDNNNLLKLEDFYINKINSINPNFGFNLKTADVNKSGFKFSEQSRAKMSVSTKEYARNNQKKYCKYGHLYTKENTYIGSTGWRSCIQCAKELSEKRNSIKKKITLEKRKNKTHCKNGHVMGKDNIYIDKNGYKCCHQCKKDRSNKWFRKNQSKGIIKQDGYCLHGHKLDGDNIYINQYNTKCCRVCKNISSKKYKDRKKNV